LIISPILSSPSPTSPLSHLSFQLLIPRLIIFAYSSFLALLLAWALTLLSDDEYELALREAEERDLEATDQELESDLLALLAEAEATDAAETADRETHWEKDEADKEAEWAATEAAEEADEPTDEAEDEA
jgi:hypothetical protein